MKKIILFTLIGLILNVHNIQAQKNTGGAVAIAAAGAIAGAVAAGIAIERYKEQMELYATEHLLESQDDVKKFELSIIDFEGVKSSDLSNVSIINFGVRQTNEANLQENKVLMMFLSRGWLTEFGVDVTRVKWKLLATDEWDNIFFTYIELASPVKLANKNTLPIYKETPKSNYLDNGNFIVHRNSSGIAETFQKSSETTKIGLGKLSGSEFQYFSTLKSIEGKFELAFPLTQFNGDTYLLKDFSPEFKVIYNERTMGLFIKSLDRLVQIKRSTVNLIHTFLH
jgi:hypothetical protein